MTARKSVPDFAVQDAFPGHSDSVDLLIFRLKTVIFAVFKHIGNGKTTIFTGFDFVALSLAILRTVR